MLIKTKNSLPSTTVKKTATTCLTLMMLGLSATPMSAFASSFTKERVITVSFKASDLQTETGKAEVYEMLLEKAVTTCKADLITLRVLGETVDECAKDLMEQFVESASIEPLAAYHAAQSTL